MRLAHSSSPEALQAEARKLGAWAPDFMQLNLEGEQWLIGGPTGRPAFMVNVNKMATSLAKACPGYLQSVHLLKTRTHQNVHIPVNAGKAPFRHLILLGKNGAGKTTTLEGMAQWFSNPGAETQIHALEEHLEQIGIAKKNLKLQPKDTSAQTRFQQNLDSFAPAEHSSKQQLEELEVKFGVRTNGVRLNDETATLFVYVKALVQFVGTPVDGPSAQNIESLKGNPNLDRISFTQYLVNRRMEQALLREDGDGDKADALAAWFKTLERDLSELLDESVSLIFERKPNFRFLLKRNTGPLSPFEALPSGWNALLGLLSKLIITYDAHKKDPITDEWPAILLFDEPELHLHPGLQWTVLPTISKLFPHLQIVAATQSPIVAASLPHATVFDLNSEKLLPPVYGSPPDSTLLRAFGARLRPAELEEQLTQVEKLFDEEKWSDAKGALDLFAEQVGEQDPDVIRLFTALELSKALDS